MRRIDACAGGLTLAFVCAACGPADRSAGAPARSQKAAEVTAPTVLLVTIDTLRADRVGCYGRANAGTPALDELAATGVRFAAAQTTAPLTLPAHASIMTGRSVPAHAVLNNGTFALPASVPVLAEKFRAAGYATGAFVSSAVLSRRYGLARGFERYDDRTHGMSQSGVQLLNFEERPGVETVDRALAWIQDQSSRPVFLWVHLMEPHTPYTPPAPYAERFAQDKYQGEVAAADGALQRLLAGLRTFGRSERRLTVVVADHGESLGAHGEATHGMFLYRETLQVPLILHGPGWGIAPRVIDAPVSTADIAPSLLALASAEPLRDADGASFAGAALGREALPVGREVFAESHIPRLEFGWSGLRALVGRTYKVIQAPRPEFYDLTSDPGEQHDLAGGKPDEVRGALGRLDALVRRASQSEPQDDAEHGGSSEELAQLRALGYASGGATRARGPLVDARRTDPKDRAAFLVRFDAALALRHDPTAAAARFAELRAIDPRCPAVLFEEAQTLILAERLDDARARLTELVKIEPTAGMAWLRLGQLHDHAGRAAEAERAYRRAAECDRRSKEALKALGSLLAERGRVREAIDVLEQAKALDAGDASVTRDLEALYRRSR